jgi:hypothetical protein
LIRVILVDASSLVLKFQDLDQQLYALKRQQPSQPSYLPPPVTQTKTYQEVNLGYPSQNVSHLPPPNLPAPSNLAPG